MTAFYNITEAETDPGAPPKSELWKAWWKNPIAIAEGTSGAPVASTGWHPYDLTAAGGTEDGTVYDFSVDGAVASVAMPALADGYEYAIKLNGVSSAATGVTQNLLVRATMSDASTHDFILVQSTNDARNYSGIVAFPMCRALLREQTFQYISAMVTNLGANESETPNADLNGTPVKVASLSVRFTSVNIDAGTIQFLRRREYVSG
jgi:hypothetical protein